MYINSFKSKSTWQANNLFDEKNKIFEPKNKRVTKCIAKKLFLQIEICVSKYELKHVFKMKSY